MQKMIRTVATALGMLIVDPALAIDQVDDAAARSLLESAQLWESKQRPDLARLALEKLLVAQPAHPAGSLRLGELEIRSGRIEQARQILETLRAQHPQHDATRELAITLRLATDDRLALATLRRLMETGRRAEATQAAQKLFPEGAPPGPYGKEFRALLSQAAPPNTDLPATAPAARTRKTYRRRPITSRPPARPMTIPAAAPALSGLSRDEQDRLRAAALREQAGVARAAQRNSEALRLLEEAQALRPADPWLRFDLAKLYVQLGLKPEARSLMAEAMALAPADIDTRYANALLLAALDEDTDALAVVRSIPVSERSQGMSELEQRLLASLERRRQRQQQAYLETLLAQQEARLKAERARRPSGFLATGFSYYDKPGESGISQYTSRQLPLEWRLRYQGQGEYFLVADSVWADAGKLPADYDTAALYGTVQAHGPGSLSTFPAEKLQEASGIGLGLGWQGDRLRVDAGTTPAGFPVRQWLGGLRWSDRLLAIDYRVDLARRPITSSLLSYAGGIDPVTGKRWGGVVANGLEGRLDWSPAWWEHRLSFSATSGNFLLTGKNVPDNAHFAQRLAGDWRLFDTDDQRFSLGLSLTRWTYDKNLSQYTLGHGGYYSPQQYLSLGLPFEWIGRRANWSYLLRGSVSTSQSRNDSQPFYPGHPDLQQLADNSPLPAGYARPIYPGNQGSGNGYALRGALEYRFAPGWYWGSSFEIDRSAFYTPNFFSSYLRYEFNRDGDWLPFPPRPPRAYASY